MKHLPRSVYAFTLIELLVVVSILGILITLVATQAPKALDTARMTQTLNNARQLQLATLNMSVDTAAAGSGVSWTTGTNGETLSVSTFSQALMDGKYVTGAELQKLYTAKGIVINNTNFAANNIAFAIMATSESTPSDQPFLITKNWQSGALTTNAPYGDLGFVVFTKGGSGGKYTRATDANNPSVVGTNYGALTPLN